MCIKSVQTRGGVGVGCGTVEEDFNGAIVIPRPSGIQIGTICEL